MNCHAKKRNWRQYNQNLINRGSITFWIQQDCLDNWIQKTGKRGRPRFSTSVIQAAWMIKTIYRLPLRGLQGFLMSILRLMGQPLYSPHYTLFCKRAKEAADNLPRLSARRPTDLVIDSSGFKIFGEGEWKVKMHGAEKRRGWIKLHVALDPKSQELIAVEITNEQVADATVLPHLIEQSPQSVKNGLADGAYDTANCRRSLTNRGISPCIPPRKNARLRKGKEFEERNEAALSIAGLGKDNEALAIWKILTGYHQRSLVETAFSRLKRLFGERLNNKLFNQQAAEVLFRCHTLNRVTRAHRVN